MRRRPSWPPVTTSGESVNFGTGQLSLKCREGGDDLGCLECSVSASDVHLAEYPRIHESLDGGGCGFECPANERGGAVGGQDRRTGKHPEEHIRSRVGTDRTELFAPCCITSGPSLSAIARRRTGGRDTELKLRRLAGSPWCPLRKHHLVGCSRRGCLGAEGVGRSRIMGSTR